MKLKTITLLSAALCLWACGKEPGEGEEQHAHSDGVLQPAAAAPAGHGSETDLGTLAVAGREFQVTRLGELVAGQEGAFALLPQGISKDELSKLNLYLWVEDRSGEQLSAPAKGSLEGESLHFHVTPKQSDDPPVRLVLRLRGEGLDERAGLPLSGHGHEHPEGAHGGIPASYSGEGLSGRLELKLHDDKGDLELWLDRDLPLESTVEVEFIDLPDRTAKLAPRNQERNEDEDGVANVRDGKTNYFIYPGDTGEDSTWLQGGAFQSIVVVRFTADDVACESEEFVLKPHTHAGDQDH